MKSPGSLAARPSSQAHPPRPALSTGGFTLIELLVVLVIIGLLVAVAAPTYRAHMQRAYRAQAAAALLQAQQFMERLYSVQGSYLGPGDSLPELPVALQTVASDGREIYRLKVDRADASGYRLRAEPQGIARDDPCGDLTLDHTSLKDRTGLGPSVQECWR